VHIDSEMKIFAPLYMTTFMKKSFLFFTILFIVFACAEEEKNTTITGDIKGLKKGTLYLEKLSDSTMVTVDSLVMSGKSDFIFKMNLESPEVLYLFLRKTDGTNIEDGIEFFAEPGTITINTTLNDFEANAQISGSVNHDKFLEYQRLMQRYQDKGLDFFVENFEAERDGDEARKIEINQKYESLIKSRYMATINFAINHKEYEVAPYLALSEIFDANVKYLDTIYNALTPTVQNSTYGRQLENYIKERKVLESN
jgi:hypothetical protein